MKKALTWGLVTASFLLLAGCGQKQSANSHEQSADRKQATTTQQATPLTATDKLLKQVSANIPEDRSTRSGNGEVTYSQFYEKNRHWYWHLTSAARGTIAKGKVQSLKNADGLEKKLTMSDEGSTYTLNFRWLDSLNLGYKVQTDHLNIKGDYVLCDAQVPGKWIKGAPTAVKGTWKSGFYASTGDKQYPYVKTTYTISDDSKNGVNTVYKADKKTKQDGAGWGANNDLQYKKLGAGVYMLKSYNGEPDLTKVRLANNQLTIYYQAPKKYAIPVMHRVGDAPADSSEAASTSATSADASVDTTNLTTAQVEDWVWRNFRKSKDFNDRFIRDDYSIEPGMDDDGLVSILVRENHSSPNMKKAAASPGHNPTVAIYKIDSKGRLIETENMLAQNDMEDRVVATSFDE